MRDSFEVSSSSGNYAIVSGAGLLADIVEKNPDAVFIVDGKLVRHIPSHISRVVVIEAVEANKSLEAMSNIILQLRNYGVNRDSHLVAVGGGVIQDIATFAASIYMRGITWTYMPTTLLGMADSCIGGKSSINVLGYKNLVGNFYPPEQVLIDLDFVGSLDEEQIVGGLYEAVKICYARGYKAFQEYLSDAPALPISSFGAQRVVMRALRAKKWFIENDEFDQKERLLLNFGHTFGHALEAGTGFGVSHGIAVGIGMLIAIEYADRRLWLSPQGVDATRQLTNYVRTLLGEGENCAVNGPEQIDLVLVLEKFNNDKKHRSDSYRMVVPRGDGALELVSEPRTEAVRMDITAVYRNVLKSIGWDVRYQAYREANTNPPLPPGEAG
ncbi:3-dehydroquinate synthase [Candidatus Methylospira mobilis]|nr:3-dehydroquinate synthase family protein [Candidatus Methylospira mobilis]